MDHPLQRIYKLKVALLSVATATLGLSLLVVAKYSASTGWLGWLGDFPVFELGSTLFVTGSFVIAYGYIDGRDKEQRDDERLRRVIAESAPAFRDAVVRSFAVDSTDLERVATPSLLDSITTNALALRLGDRQFAEEIYAQVRDQVISAPERWYDVAVSVRLSSIDERDAASVPRFQVTVQWDYTVTPGHAVRRFACVSDRDEYRELVSDSPATSTWFMTPRPGFDAGQREAFELLQFRVDGQPRPIRRTTKRSGQVYSTSVGADVVAAGNPVRVSHIYRVVTPQSGHRLFFEIPQPTRGFSLSVDYTQTDISHLSVTDLVSTSQHTRVSQLPIGLDGKELRVELPGWLLPKAGFTFVWTLSREEQADGAAGAARPAPPTTRAA